MGLRSTLKKGTRLATLVHRHDLYEAAVQDPVCEIKFLGRTFQRLTGRSARTLREDFCGTAALSVAWCRSDPGRTATGIDLDSETLAYGRRHRVESAGSSVAERVTLRQANVLEPGVLPVDVSVAFNFSYFTFKSRETLLRYFRTAHAGLVEDGLFVLDGFAGPEASQVGIDRRKVEAQPGWGFRSYVYAWEQERFDPRTGEILCHIHFEFSDGSRLARAFTYDWRQWTLPELRDLLHEAGFARVRMFWEREDDDGDGTEVFYEPRRCPANEGQFWVYIVAEKKR